MHWITSWGDTLPSWLGAVGGVLSVVLAFIAIVQAARANQRHVEWQQVVDEPESTSRPTHFRLINGTQGRTAHVLAVTDVSDGLKDAVRNDLMLPAIVVPGSGVPLTIERSLASPYPTAISITWRESKTHRRPRGRKLSSTFYFS